MGLGRCSVLNCLPSAVPSSVTTCASPVPRRHPTLTAAYDAALHRHAVWGISRAHITPPS
jgi:hypothetical protein